MWYETIKKYYTQGIYNDENLEVFVKAGMLTQEQANEIKASK